MERIPRGGIRSVDVFVARHAGTPDNSDAHILELSAVVNRRRVIRPDVAPLTEHRHFGDEQPFIRRPVRIVTGHTAFTSWRMLEQERPALLRVAADARLV